MKSVLIVHKLQSLRQKELVQLLEFGEYMTIYYLDLDDKLLAKIKYLIGAQGLRG